MPVHYLVVPDSLAADRSGNPLPKPSFVYQAVLNAVALRATAEDTIVLAPGNTFASGCNEEQAAYAYLKAAGCLSTILCPGITLPPVPDPGRYIDTWGNAAVLGTMVDPAIPYRLVVASRHAPRAAWCFRKYGFQISEVAEVAYEVKDEPVVGRHWYYRYPTLHSLYETAAWIRDWILHVR